MEKNTILKLTLSYYIHKYVKKGVRFLLCDSFPYVLMDVCVGSNQPLAQIAAARACPKEIPPSPAGSDSCT